MIKKSSIKYNIKFKFSDAKSAFQDIIGKTKKRLDSKIKLFGDNIYIPDDKIFGPQPFLAIKTKNKKYYHENFI